VKKNITSAKLKIQLISHLIIIIINSCFVRDVGWKKDFHCFYYITYAGTIPLPFTMLYNIVEIVTPQNKPLNNCILCKVKEL